MYQVSSPACQFIISTSSTTGTYNAHPQLGQPEVDNGNVLVKPTDTALHLKYTFYIRITVSSTIEWFGPYYLDTGCTTTSLSGTANGNGLETTCPNKNVGDDGSAFYSFVSPVSARAYCAPIQNVATETDGTTASSKVTQGA